MSPDGPGNAGHWALHLAEDPVPAVDAGNGEPVAVPRRQSRATRPPALVLNTTLLSCYRDDGDLDGSVLYLTDGAVRVILPINTGGELVQVRNAAATVLRRTRDPSPRGDAGAPYRVAE